MRFRDRKGSVTILALLFFAVICSMMAAFLNASKQRAVAGMTKELGFLWASSVLGEYDLDLRERYDLFAYRDRFGETEAKLNMLARDSFGSKRYIQFEGAAASLETYSLQCCDPFRKQIVFLGRMDTIGKLPEKKPAGSGNLENGALPSGSFRTELPSAGSERGLTLETLKRAAKKWEDPADAVRGGTDRYFETRYLFRYFKDRMDDHGLGRTYFRNEIEYVVCGKKSDRSNEQSLRLRIIAVREVCNYLYLMQDPQKQAEILEAAALLVPAPAVPAAQQLLTAAWALAESNNDYELLIRGKKVPFRKDPASWAVDLESIVSGGLAKKTETGFAGDASGSSGASDHSGDRSSSGVTGAEPQLPELKSAVPFIDPGTGRGNDYEDYLMFFTALLDERILLLRMMDLIQINLQYTCDGQFLMRECYTGMTASFRVNGKTYEIRKTYQ